MLIMRQRWHVCSDDDAKRLGLPVESSHTGGCLTSEAPPAISCWRTQNTVNVLVSKPDAELMLDKIQQLQAELESRGEPTAHSAA